ncbi:type II toxin-antitoxin system VapC family toxin [Candidatus Harpocratesius sp.]
MITIDSQIWIYYFDPNARENQNVHIWMNSNLKNAEIILNAIIPIEVAHTLYGIPNIPHDHIESLIFKWITQKNIKITKISNKEMINALQMLKVMRFKGVGGRDCLILATMHLYSVSTLVTNDKNLLSLVNFKRINPIFDPPLILEKGDKFNREYYQKKNFSLE